MLQDLQSKFINNFIAEDRWKYLTDGLAVTLQITLCAVILGIVLGFLVAIVRSTHDRTGKLKILNALCNLYLTVIRGTPVVVQLLILYFVIFGSSSPSKVMVAVLAFGINSGAYVAEIFRSGIMSIDNGQFEAGRSLASTTGRLCSTSSCPRHSRMCCRPLEMSSSPFSRKPLCPAILPCRT